MCSVRKRVRVALHPIGRNQSAAKISLCNVLLTEVEAEQRPRHSKVTTTRGYHRQFEPRLPHFIDVERNIKIKGNA